MKKSTLITTLALLAFTLPFCISEAAENASVEKGNVTIEKKAPDGENFKRPPMPPEMQQRKLDFEKNIKLTDEQKEKAKAIREAGQKEMKTIADKIKEKREEIAKIEKSSLSDEQKKEKIKPLRTELSGFVKLGQQLRVKNMKEFEGILTKKQLKKLDKMKEKARKEFRKNMKNGKNGSFRPPMPPNGNMGQMPPKMPPKGMPNGEFKAPPQGHPDGFGANKGEFKAPPQGEFDPFMNDDFAGSNGDFPPPPPAEKKSTESK